MKVFVVIALCVATVAVIQASPTADLREQATDLTSIEAADSQQSDSNVESSERSGRPKRFIFHLLKWAYLCSVANSVTAGKAALIQKLLLKIIENLCIFLWFSVKVAQPVTYQVNHVMKL